MSNSGVGVREVMCVSVREVVCVGVRYTGSDALLFVVPCWQAGLTCWCLSPFSLGFPALRCCSSVIMMRSCGCCLPLTTSLTPVAVCH